MILSVRRPSIVPTGGSSIAGGNQLNSLEKRGSFQDALSGAQQALKVPRDPFQAMKVLTERVTSGAQMKPRELLMFQIRAGEYGMTVELVSKVAESGSSSLRRLQNQG
ncbi:MAG: hypothetical protein KDD70_11540 [Bdellovibrionales bacterium]|nr:hypothetical protein [Bdellovibrionales bacterium]